jgi:hypothetical protein
MWSTVRIIEIIWDFWGIFSILTSGQYIVHEVILRCCYMAYSLQRFNAVFFTIYISMLHISRVSIFQRQVLSICIYFNHHFSIMWEGKHAARYCIVCMPGLCNRFALPAGHCLSNCLTWVYHKITPYFIEYWKLKAWSCTDPDVTHFLCVFTI